MGILRADLLTHSQLQPTGSVFFDGTDDKITTTGFGNIGTSDFTLECWVYLSTTSGIQRIISANEGSQSTEYTQIRSHSTHGWQGYIGTDSGWWEAHSGNDHPSWTTGWHHVVLQRFGNDGYIFVDGEYAITDQDGSSASNAADPVTITTFVLGHGYGSEYLNAGYISNARVSMKAVYGGNNFTVPKLELQPRGDTYLLCCQSSSSSSEATVLPRDVSNPTAGLSVTGAVASSFTPGLKKDITDTGVVFDGFTTFATSTYIIPPSGKTTERNRGRGVMAGGETPSRVNTITFTQIQSSGNFQDFGDLIGGDAGETRGVGSSTRGVFFTNHGGSSGQAEDLEFITFANQSNGTDFGDLPTDHPMRGSAGNETRGIFAGGYKLSLKNEIEFITIATTGNGTDFGNLTGTRNAVAGLASPTRALFGGGSNPSNINNIDIVTIATTGDASDFGDLTRTGKEMGGVASNTRGVFAGARINPSTASNVIDFVTIASAGNAIDFGDLTQIVASPASMTDSVRGLFAGGYTPSPSFSRFNSIDFINIASTGNASDFGDLTYAQNYGGGCSDSHGGLS